ncbi:colanic acid biosynthesis glycosyl transferase WcaI [Dokdonia sp. Hel_I_63]|uniref:glycosyltransferase n=1 Tax=Dokdonia sp. Hel_I_63 TaxID=1249996 RepID=UPI001199C6AB|nr:glycosyltransferase [Dokdonia sp. Hel_I_63]TVZ21584.1 colanic acid biosynthesis glycosyl transferase WcaI [Dokdonia sp. Hel_I_63]
MNDLQGKHITLISLNFYPEDTAIGLYSTQLAEYLESQGALLSVITAFPYYPKWEIAESYQNKGTYLHEKKGTIDIYRYKQFTPKEPTFLKRVIHIADFTIGSRFNFKQITECDIVISVIPFTSSAWLGNTLSRKRNAKHWIHIQDFEFDAAFQSGLASGNENTSFAYKTLMKLERSILNKADCVSTISYTMLAKLKEKTTSENYYLPNWIDADQSDPLKAEEHSYFSKEKFSILYSGNVGDKQDWQLFTNVIKALDFNKFEVIVVGAGAKMEALKENLKNTKVKFYAPVPFIELSSLLASADVHILFQKSEVVDTVMPSKILGMMASARPSIITGHPDAEPAKIITDSNGGIYNSVIDYKLILSQLDTLNLSPDTAMTMGAAARKYVLEKFARKPILEKFTQTLSRL